MARPRCCRVCKISVFDAVLRHFYFPFFPTFEIAFIEKRELATPFSFLCMPSTVSGSNSWSFAIIGDLSLEAWQRSLRMTGEADVAKSSQLFFPFFFFFFFFASFLLFLKKAFPERKIALEIFPKKDEGALQITVQSMTNATFETVGQVRKAIFACLTTDLKKCLYLYFLALLYFLHALLMAKTAYHCLKKKCQGVTSLSLRRILNQGFFSGQPC